MNAARWTRLQELAEAAADLPSGERSAWLAERCAGDPELCAEAGRMAAALSEPDLHLEEAVLSAARHAAVLGTVQAGDRIGAYRVLDLLGQGGMGVVYRAERADGAFEQQVALKVVGAGFGMGEALLARFRTERQVLAGLAHQHIARLLDGGLTPAGLPYLVLEYIEGESLIAYAQHHTLTVEQRLELFAQVCAAVEYAHGNLVVHRDLKPANVLVTADGQAKLLDFGIAKLLADGLEDERGANLTAAAERLMTPEYASPEQVRGGRITTATDVWGLGVLLYELLTGQTPFALTRLSPAEAERVVCETQPVAPSERTEELKLSRDLDRIVLKAMHREPERRYRSAGAMAADVMRFRQGFPVAARPDSVQYRTAKFIERHRWSVSAAVLFVLTVLGLGVGLAVQARRAQREAASADAVSNYLIALFNSAQPDSTQGRSTSARDLLDQGVAHLDSTWTGDLAAKARLLSTLGSVYYQLGAFQEAQELFQRSAAIYRQLPGGDPAALADVLNSLGEAELDNGDYEKSLRDYGESVRLFSQYRPESAELADSMDGLSGILWETGDYAGSERYHLESIGMASRVIGPDAPMTLVDKNNLSVLYADMGRYQEAEKIDREVLATRLRVFGEHNSHTTSSMDHLGFVLERQGKFDEAYPLLVHALELREQLFGRHHSRIATSLLHLSLFFRDTGHPEAAEPCAREALQTLRTLGADRSFELAAAQRELGMVLLAQGKLPESRSHLEAAQRLQGSHPFQNLFMQSQNNEDLSRLELAEDHPDQALQLARTALKQTRSAFPLRNIRWAEAENTLGAALLHTGDLHGAAEAFHSALEITRKEFGERPHPLSVDADQGLGDVELARADRKAAQPWLERAAAMRQSWKHFRCSVSVCLS